jgi:hypothetical protein
LGFLKNNVKKRFSEMDWGSDAQPNGIKKLELE